jgi:protoporphyrinogen oxidase
MYHQGRFYPFDSILAALLFPGLGWGVDKVRFGLVGLYLRMTNNWKPLEKVTVDSWMRKWAGERVYQMMWEPLLVGKFGPHYKEVNMAWMWARLKARTTRLGTFRGGFQAFADRLAERLRAMGVEINLSEGVESIQPESSRSPVSEDWEWRADIRSGLIHDLAGALGSPGTFTCC